MTKVAHSRPLARPLARLMTGLAVLTLVACETGPEPYKAATGNQARGYQDLQIESNRFRVAYRSEDARTAHDYALLRAAELTLAQGADWFRVVNAYSEGRAPERGGNTSVSVGGSTGSYGSSVGVGVGIGVGGGRVSGDAERVLEILTGTGPAPDDPAVYDAAEVQGSLLGAPPPG